MCEASIIFFSELRWHKTICMGLVGENKTIDKGWHRNAYVYEFKDISNTPIYWCSFKTKTRIVMFIILLGRLTMGVLFILKKQVGVDQGTTWSLTF